MNTILQNSIVGESSDNVAIGENLKGEMQIYSVVAKDYFGQPNVCLLYDKNGLLVQNADNIFADANSKNIITRHPTQENKYWLFSRNKLGELFRSEILVTSTQTAVTAKNIPIAATSRVGAHFTAVERRGENATILLYATRNNTATQKAEVFVVSMNATAVAVLPTIASLPYTETDLYHGGELQISPDGKQLLWYHLGQRAAFFDYQNIKPYSFILGDNIAGVVANPAGTAIIPTEIPGTPTLGNPNPDAVPNPLRSAFTLKTHASIDIDKVENENNIYFTQKTINNIDNLYENSILQLGATTAGNLRRGKVSGEVRQAVGLGTGLPVQVHTLLDTPASAPTRVQASRLLRVRSFELKDHLGNIRVLVSDQKDADADAQVQSYYNYYAFGMEMPNRTYEGIGAYRYGFNGQEKSPEIADGHATALYWEYDSRIGRRWNLDPKPQTSFSDYSTFENNPITHSDVLGDVAIVRWKGKNEKGKREKQEARYIDGQWVKWVKNQSAGAIDINKVSKAGVKRLMQDYHKLNQIPRFKTVVDAVNKSKIGVTLHPDEYTKSDVDPTGKPISTSYGSAVPNSKYFQALETDGNAEIDVYATDDTRIPKACLEQGTPTTLPSYITLGHELGHVWDIITGGKTNMVAVGKNGVSHSEINAMYWENVLRDDAGIGLRLYYDKGKTFKSSLEPPTIWSFGFPSNLRMTSRLMRTTQNTKLKEYSRKFTRDYETK